jgi:hypothetical protein
VITKGQAKSFSYDVYINGAWIPIEYKELNKILYIPSTLLKKGDNIKIIAEDQLQNRSELEFVY